jgi:hypothetical protein
MCSHDFLNKIIGKLTAQRLNKRISKKTTYQGGFLLLKLSYLQDWRFAKLAAISDRIGSCAA